MWQRAMPFVLALSVALNVPFVAMWASQTVLWRRSDVPENHEIPRPPRPGHHDPDRPPHGLDSLMRKIGVTEEQWHKMEARQIAFHDSLGESFRQTEKLDAELIDLLAAPEPNRDAIRAKQEEVLETHRKRQELMVEQLLADKKDLTAEQQTKLFAILRRMRGPGRPGRPGQPPPPLPPGAGGPRHDFSAKKHGPPFGPPPGSPPIDHDE